MYYNDAIKQEYLASIKSQSQQKVIFRNIASIESEFQKDAAELDNDTLLRFLNSICSFSPTTNRGIITAIRGYASWYRNKFPEKEYPTFTVSLSDIDVSEKMKTHLYSSYEDLLSDFEHYNFDNGDPVAPIVSLCWAGLTPPEVFNLLEENIDWKNGLVFDSTHTLIIREMPPKMLSILQRYKAVSTAIVQRGQLETWYVVDSPYFIRYIKPKNGSDKNKGKPFASDYFLTAVKRATSEFEEKSGRKSRIDGSNAYYSGLFYRLHQYLKDNPNIADVNVQMRIRTIMRAGGAVSTSSILSLYNMYKRAFDL